MSKDVAYITRVAVSADGKETEITLSNGSQLMGITAIQACASVNGLTQFTISGYVLAEEKPDVRPS